MRFEFGKGSKGNRSEDLNSGRERILCMLSKGGGRAEDRQGEGWSLSSADCREEWDTIQIQIQIRQVRL